jgi:hypothetical protein
LLAGIFESVETILNTWVSTTKNDKSANRQIETKHKILKSERRITKKEKKEIGTLNNKQSQHE